MITTNNATNRTQSIKLLMDTGQARGRRPRAHLCGPMPASQPASRPAEGNRPGASHLAGTGPPLGSARGARTVASAPAPRVLVRRRARRRARIAVAGGDECAGERHRHPPPGPGRTRPGAPRAPRTCTRTWARGSWPVLAALAALLVRSGPACEAAPVFSSTSLDYRPAKVGRTSMPRRAGVRLHRSGDAGVTFLLLTF